MPFEKRWLRPAEAAERLGVSTKTVLNRIAKKTIPFSRGLGSHAPRVDWLELERRLEKEKLG